MKGIVQREEQSRLSVFPRFLSSWNTERRSNMFDNPLNALCKSQPKITFLHLHGASGENFFSGKGGNLGSQRTSMKVNHTIHHAGAWRFFKVLSLTFSILPSSLQLNFALSARRNGMSVTVRTSLKFAIPESGMDGMDSREDGMVAGGGCHGVDTRRFLILS